MSDASIHTPAQTKEASFGDFFALLKPRVMSLVVFTAMVGLLAAPGLHVHPVRGFCGDPVYCDWGRGLWCAEHVV